MIVEVTVSGVRVWGIAVLPQVVRLTSAVIATPAQAVQKRRQPPAAPPPKKKFRRIAVRASNHATQLPAVIDVDAESSCAPQQHLLSEADFFPTDTELAVTKDTG